VFHGFGLVVFLRFDRSIAFTHDLDERRLSLLALCFSSCMGSVALGESRLELGIFLLAVFLCLLDYLISFIRHLSQIIFQL
jgi:hypothetical protein